MKKIAAIIISVMMILPCNIAMAADGYTPPGDVVTQEEAYQFADELKEMNQEDYEVSARLIVGSKKEVDDMGAVSAATGIDDLYIFQYENQEQAAEAFSYYESLSYVEYVEYDCEQENVICSEETDDEFDFVADCYSTVNSNIDDAIKLMNQENVEMSEITVAIVDSGVALTSFTEDRFDGGYSYFDNYAEDGTDDKLGHGTEVAGTVIQNTQDNVKIRSYQILNSEGSGTISGAVSAIIKAASDGCKVINCSFGFTSSNPSSLTTAVDTAVKSGSVVICSAGNDSSELSTLKKYPALAENAITVGATTSINILASFSNFGDGVDIYATGTNLKTYNKNGNKTSYSGTSASTPVISSICALLVLTKPDITASEIKSLLLETGKATNEENQTDENRVIADAYECIKQLTGTQLEQVQLGYTVTENEETGYADIQFFSDDKNVRIYYCNTLGSLYPPYTTITVTNMYEYELGSTISESGFKILTAYAYAPGKAKSNMQIIVSPDYSYESGYLMSEASATQEYNIISRCNIIDETTIEVPEYIDGVEVQEIGAYTFAGNQTVETIILPECVKQIDEYAFANCPNLKTVIAPGVESCGEYTFYQCENLVEVEIPNLTVANTAMFKGCTNLERAKLGYLTEIDNQAFYGCENLKLVKTTDDDISFCARTFYNCNTLTIYTPDGSVMETFAVNNDIPLVGDIQLNGGSICISVAGLRLGFQYNAELNPNIEEYGFVYNCYENGDLYIDNVGEGTTRQLVASNRIDHGEYTTYNLVLTSMPSSAYEQSVYARAYIEIGGEYFYSDIQERSFSYVANAVLEDDEVSQDIKDRVSEMLSA